ncbi:hypothetical protein SAMN04488055_2497 [Chitinophaga niabensis]|uniref:Uncharacterized protein n=2 Tax=Chitinophaga niabensis TaxID=536979 RepID=A0A1N6FZ99_9BACT|nr:hypothetical protein SAMN04488055_2497 [Chitinophaga niabensis]
MQTLLPGTAMCLLVALFLFSCNKDNDANPNAGNENLAAAAKAVTGNLVQGNVKAISGPEGLILHINDLDILVEKALGNTLYALPDMPSAAVITSEYGLILKDLARGNVYFLVNNDEESISKFNSVASLFPSIVNINKIFGTTIVRNS